MKLITDRPLSRQSATRSTRPTGGRGVRSPRTRNVHFDTLVADLLGNAVTPRVVLGIAQAIATDKTCEDELLGQVKMHNLLCRYFAGKRAEAGLPDTNCPTPITVTVIRRDQ